MSSQLLYSFSRWHILTRSLSLSLTLSYVHVHTQTHFHLELWGHIEGLFLQSLFDRVSVSLHSSTFIRRGFGPVLHWDIFSPLAPLFSHPSLCFTLMFFSSPRLRLMSLPTLDIMHSELSLMLRNPVLVLVQHKPFASTKCDHGPLPCQWIHLRQQWKLHCAICNAGEVSLSKQEQAVAACF